MLEKFRLAGIICSGLLITLASVSVMASGIKGSGKLATQTRKLPSYHAIKLKVPADLTAEVGAAGDLSIEAEDNLLPHIISTVTNGELLISNDESFNTSKHIVIKAKAAKLDQLSIYGASTTVIKGLAGGSFTTAAEGASTITMDGKVDKLSASLKGAGSLKAATLAAKSATVSITGAGEAEVNATNDLNASITGAGSIKYKGNPKVSKQVLGAGVIEKF